MALFETLKYELEYRQGNLEIRKYNDFLLASTKTELNRSNDSGFNNVFRYISGDNSENKKISMTTPVVTYEEEGELVTGFYVPSQFDETNVPKPKSNRVFIDKMKTSLFAVIKFRGNWTESNFEKHDAILKKFIEEKNYKIISQRYLMRYQPPFVPGMLRKNEIAYRIIKQ